MPQKANLNCPRSTAQPSPAWPSPAQHSTTQHSCSPAHPMYLTRRSISSFSTSSTDLPRSELPCRVAKKRKSRCLRDSVQQTGMYVGLTVHPNRLAVQRVALHRCKKQTQASPGLSATGWHVQADRQACTGMHACGAGGAPQPACCAASCPTAQQAELRGNTVGEPYVAPWAAQPAMSASACTCKPSRHLCPRCRPASLTPGPAHPTHQRLRLWQLDRDG